MTRMTGPDCAVMCNLINTYTHTHTHTHIYIHTLYTHTYRSVRALSYSSRLIAVPSPFQDTTSAVAPENILKAPCSETDKERERNKQRGVVPCAWD